MPDAVGDISYDDFMDPLALAQLADDTALYAEKIENRKPHKEIYQNLSILIRETPGT